MVCKIGFFLFHCGGIVPTLGLVLNDLRDACQCAG